MSSKLILTFVSSIQACLMAVYRYMYMLSSKMCSMPHVSLTSMRMACFLSCKAVHPYTNGMTITHSTISCGTEEAIDIVLGVVHQFRFVGIHGANIHKENGKPIKVENEIALSQNGVHVTSTEILVTYDTSHLSALYRICSC